MDIILILIAVNGLCLVVLLYVAWMLSSIAAMLKPPDAVGHVPPRALPPRPSHDEIIEIFKGAPAPYPGGVLITGSAKPEVKPPVPYPWGNS